jgi:hypothetical protein
MPTEHDQSKRASRVIGWPRWNKIKQKLYVSSRTLPQLASGERTAVYLEIPFEQAGLMREVLRIACREASQRADPRHFNGTGALQDAIAKLHECIDQQLRQKGVPE